MTSNEVHRRSAPQSRDVCNDGLWGISLQFDDSHRPIEPAFPANAFGGMENCDVATDIE